MRFISGTGVTYLVSLVILLSIISGVTQIPGLAILAFVIFVVGIPLLYLDITHGDEKSYSGMVTNIRLAGSHKSNTYTVKNVHGNEMKFPISPWNYTGVAPQTGDTVTVTYKVGKFFKTIVVEKISSS